MCWDYDFVISQYFLQAPNVPYACKYYLKGTGMPESCVTKSINKFYIRAQPTNENTNKQINTATKTH